jgi:hypothetical protein
LDALSHAGFTSQHFRFLMETHISDYVFGSVLATAKFMRNIGLIVSGFRLIVVNRPNDPRFARLREQIARMIFELVRHRPKDCPIFFPFINLFWDWKTKVLSCFLISCIYLT